MVFNISNKIGNLKSTQTHWFILNNYRTNFNNIITFDLKFVKHYKISCDNNMYVFLIKFYLGCFG